MFAPKVISRIVLFFSSISLFIFDFYFFVAFLRPFFNSLGVSKNALDQSHLTPGWKTWFSISDKQKRYSFVRYVFYIQQNEHVCEKKINHEKNAGYM